MCHFVNLKQDILCHLGLSKDLEPPLPGTKTKQILYYMLPCSPHLFPFSSTLSSVRGTTNHPVSLPHLKTWSLWLSLSFALLKQDNFLWVGFILQVSCIHPLLSTATTTIITALQNSHPQEPKLLVQLLHWPAGLSCIYFNPSCMQPSDQSSSNIKVISSDLFYVTYGTLKTIVVWIPFLKDVD